MEDIFIDFEEFIVDKNWKQAEAAIQNMAEHSIVEADNMQKLLTKFQTELHQEEDTNFHEITI